MNELLTKYYKLIDQLSVRAKAIMLATICIITFTIWYYGFWQKLHASLTLTLAKTVTITHSLPKLKTQLKILEKQVKDKETWLQTTLGAQQKQEAQQTSKLLYDLFLTNNKLTLLQLENAPPKEIILPPTNLKAFEHRIVVKFSGDYMATLQYLQAIEKLKWKIFWNKLEYKVINYPAAEITMDIHTISNAGDVPHV